jgi:hypothetical protein
MTRVLEDLLLDFVGEAPAELRAQLTWLERASIAASEADLGEAGDSAALDLRAVLGAFVEFSRSPQGKGEQLALELTVKTLLTRALHTLYAALAETYRELGQADTDLAPECRELARLWSQLQHSMEKGKPIRAQILRRLEAIRERTEE